MEWKKRGHGTIAQIAEIERTGFANWTQNSKSANCGKKFTELRPTNFEMMFEINNQKILAAQ